LPHNKKVIQFHSAGVWAFADFVYHYGANPIEDWYANQLSEGAQNTFDSLLKDLHKTENHLHWGGFRGFLKGIAKKHHIWEVGFKADGRQYRIFGKFAGRKQVVLLIGCYHKQGVYTPADSIETAATRAQLLSEGKAKINARPIRTDL